MALRSKTKWKFGETNFSLKKELLRFSVLAQDGPLLVGGDTSVALVCFSDLTSTGLIPLLVTPQNYFSLEERTFDQKSAIYF